MSKPKIEPCPFCGNDCHLALNSLVRCGACYYCSGIRLAPSRSIEHHNRVSAAAHAAPRHVDHQPLHEAYKSLMVSHTEALHQLTRLLDVNRELRDEYAEDSARLEEIQQLAREQVGWMAEFGHDEYYATAFWTALHAVILRDDNNPNKVG